MYRMTLKNTLLLLVLGVLVVNCLLVLFFGELFMERVYIYQKEEDLIDAYWELEGGGEPSDELLRGIEDGNVGILIIEPESREIIYNTRIHDVFSWQQAGGLISQMRTNLSEARDEPYYIHYAEAPPGVPGAGGSSINLDGRLADGSFVRLTTPNEAITESVDIAIQFSFYACAAAAVTAVFLTRAISGRITKPLTDATEVAKRMTNLDFSQKCGEGYDNEIGDLSVSINKMSDVMQSYIQELADANLKLKADIEEMARVEEARKNLISNISHDLKTPIALISGYAEGLKQGMAKTEEERREYYDIISDEAEKTLGLILRMLELSRVESGATEPQYEDFDLSEMLDNLLSAFGIATNETDLSRDYEPGIWVCSDSLLVEQSLTNYIENAISHGAPPGPSEPVGMRVSVRRGSGKVRVSVYNTAPAIPEEDMRHIWESFYKLDKSRGRSRFSAGLGLAIVRGNMRLLGCEYGAENKERGVEFWLELPAVPEDDVDAADKL